MAEEIKAPEVQSTVQPATVKDKRILPEGVIPKQAQAYVVAGLALLILLAVMFSKNHAGAKGYGILSAGYVYGRQSKEDSGVRAGLERRPAPEPAGAKDRKWHVTSDASQWNRPCSDNKHGSSCTSSGYANRETA